MDAVRLRRLSIALVAAYAMALQALLTAFIPLSVVVFADPAVLCSSVATGGEGLPASHDGSCPVHCAVVGHGAAASPPSVAIEFAVPRLAQSGRFGPAPSDAPRVASPGSGTPRGPPVV